MTFNGWTFLFEVLNFLVLAYVLHRLLYRPLQEAIDARRTATTQAQTAAEKVRKEAEALQQRLQEERIEQERQRQDLIRSNREQAEADRKRILAEAEQAVQRRQEEERQALAHERTEALDNLRSEVVQQAIAVAGRLLREAADTTLHHQLVLRLVETLRNVTEIDRAQLRDEWSVADGALLETASALDGDSLGQVHAAVAALLGQPVQLVVQARSELLGGVRLRLGGHVWDASLAGQLEPVESSQAEAVSHA
jgi:F-type H+-transporting ATPase subunit b